MFDVFICHSSVDKPRIVDPLAHELNRLGISFWLDSGEVQWGDDVVRNIDAGLKNSRFILAIITPSFADARWARREFSSALSAELSADETRVLPLFAGTEDEIFLLRREFALAYSKMFMRWDDNPQAIAARVADRLRQSTQIARLVQAENDEYVITTAFWAGRYAESATKSQTILEIALRNNDHAIAALALANLILINRSRREFAMVIYYMKKYFKEISMAKVPREYKLRLMKELFVYYYEREDFARAALYLERMERIDPQLMSYTPADDWIPGTVRWRKAHLQWLMSPSSTALRSGISLAQEGVAYLEDVLRYNPNSAGLASSRLNVGWLYFLDGGPVCIDYFEQAIADASNWSPRTEIEARIARMVAEVQFKVTPWKSAMAELSFLVHRLEAGGFPMRTYAFLKNSSELPAVKYLISQPVS